MANVFHIPFNNHPASTDYGNAARSYTCPAGKYAKIRATLCVDAKGLPVGVTASGSYVNSNSNSNSESVDFWVEAGDIVACTATAASASTGSVSTGTANGTSVATLTLNGNKIAEIKASAMAYHINSTGSTESTVDGNADVNFVVDEYNIIS